MTKTLEFKVVGMDCAECAAHVQRALSELEDVVSAQVYLGAEKAVIQYVATPPGNNEISNVVKSAGYQAVFDDENTSPQEQSDLLSFGKFSPWTFLAIALFVFTVTIFGERMGVFEYLQELIPWYVWLLVIIIGGRPIFLNVGRNALKGRIISHSLMTASVITTAVVGQWATALLIVLFMRIGDMIEQKTTEKARISVQKLHSMAPKSAKILVKGEEKEIPISEIRTGDMVVIRPGESIPVDGTTADGRASVDQSAISGESIPIEKSAGDAVYAATILKTGMLVIKTSAVGKETAFGRIIRMVEEAEANRGEFQRLADQFSGYYLPIVAAIALGTWLIRRDAIAAASVMAVACSCSFSLATPMAMLASIGSSAQKGLLFKGGKYIESLERADAVFIDKTGTLTIGEPVITDMILTGDSSEDELLQLCASAEQYSEHPLADAVLRKAAEKGLPLLEAKDFSNISGKGVTAEIAGKRIAVMNAPTRNRKQTEFEIENRAGEGQTLLFVQINGEDVGVLAAADVVRADAAQAIEDLKNMGIQHIQILSGDRTPAVRKIADDLGVAYQAKMSPEEKIRTIITSQGNGHHVVMIGDGVNDAPALAQADIGISMGNTGTAIAVETSHITLLREDWSLVPEAIATARRTMRIVRTNIFFTAVYNLIGLSLAAAGILPPSIAAALQSIPDVGIMANSARLLQKTDM